ncbi:MULTISPECIES: hypothetical protein [Mumia]|uniref:hypothetical protein n=1 Tax=Mumia TaxID=1546255 RepID=UPI00141F646B|nr:MULTISPECIES: hypothetical protein [unclassified Mumia]QMW67562.1 hypothetical protein H4N58_06630 [Mumia sp. ZJ1417]
MKHDMPWGPSPALGHFTYWPRTDTWVFSEELCAIFGFAPSMQITSEVVLDHQHPDDVARTRALIATRGLGDETGFSYQHRIVDSCGFVHEVVVVGSDREDPDGHDPITEGFMVDLSQAGGHPQRSTPMVSVEFDPVDLVITQCPHCPKWWAEVTASDDGTVVREWHEPFCPEVLRWTAPDPALLTAKSTGVRLLR